MSAESPDVTPDLIVGAPSHPNANAEQDREAARQRAIAEGDLDGTHGERDAAASQMLLFKATKDYRHLLGGGLIANR